MRRNLHHPERDAATPVDTSQVKGAESEYYAMGEEAAAKRSQIVTGEGHMSAHASVSKGGATDSKQDIAATAGHSSKSQKRRLEEAKSQKQIRYATPPAEKHESSSNKDVHGKAPSQFEQMQRSIEM